MKTCQIVFLIDLHAICKDSLEDPRENGIQLKHLRRVILKFLSYFSTQFGSATSAGLNLKWDCKYYDSSGKKPFRQLCCFRDFTSKVYQNFENELEDKLGKYWNEVNDSNQNHHHHSDIKRDIPKIFSNLLELTLKEVLCHYSWDTPYITSPVRITRSRTQQTSRNLKESDSNTTENVVIIIASLQKVVEDLKTFSGTPRNNKWTAHEIPKSILSPTLQKQFSHVNKIRLLWCDVSHNNCSPLTEVHPSQKTTYVKLIDQELQRTGGGIIPLNAVLPYISDRCNSNITPASLKVSPPFSSILSGYFRNEKSHAQGWKSCYASLTFNHGINQSLNYHLELLPLFRQNERLYHHYSKKESSKKPLTHSSTPSGLLAAATTSKHSATTPDRRFQQFPKDLFPIGTVCLHDVHSLLISRPLVFICCPSDLKRSAKSLENEVDFHELLAKLARQQRALLLSCDDVCQGILLPATSNCQVAILYILTSQEIFSRIEEGTPESTTTTPPDFRNFLKQLLHDWNPCLNNDKEWKHTCLSSNTDDFTVSVDYFEKYFHPGSNSTTLADELLVSNYNSLLKKQSIIFSKLKNAYVSSLRRKNEYKEESKTINRNDANDHGPKIQNRSTAILRQLSNSGLNSDNSSHSVVFPSDNSARLQMSGPLPIADSSEPKSEMELVASLKEMYEKAIQDEITLLSGAQKMTAMCVAFYSNDNFLNVQMAIKNIMTQNLLLKPGDVIKKHSNLSESNKKMHIREHCLQAVLRLELLLKVDSNEPETSISDIVSHLRRLSFIDGPRMSTFLRETIFENYYFCLNNIITQICDDLDQPLPNISHCASPSSSDSASPEKVCSISNFMSEASELSTSSVWSSPGKVRACHKRSSRIARHPSFASISCHRQIAISKKTNLKGQPKGVDNKSMNTRSADQKKVYPFKEGVSKKYRRHRKHCPTTPQGRHILKTTKVAETPVHKQVERPLLAKMALKRKYTSDSTDDTNVIIEESPDKKPSPCLRRSPRLHPNSSSKSFKKSSNASPSVLQRSSQKKSKRNYLQCIAERKVRACRKLNLDGSSPVCNKLKSKTVDKDCHQQSAPRRSRIQPQSDDLDSSIENISPVNRCLSSEDRRAKTRLRRFYSRNYENRQTSVSTNTSNTVNSNHEDMPTRTPKKLAVSRKILQTPSKSLDVEENCVHNELLSSDDVNSIIESTPIKRGKESPEPNRSGILGGPLSECLSYCMSPSSSPRIPLYYDNSYTNYSYQNESRTNGEENSADSDWLSISDWLPCTPLKSCHSSVESFDVVISNYSADSSDVYLKETSVEKPCLTVLNQKTSEFQKTRDQHIKHSLVRSESKNTVFTIHQKLQNSHVHQRPAFFI